MAKYRDLHRDADFVAEVVRLVEKFEEEYLEGAEDDETAGIRQPASAQKYAESLEELLSFVMGDWYEDERDLLSGEPPTPEVEALFRRAAAVIRLLGKLWGEPADRLPAFWDYRTDEPTSPSGPWARHQEAAERRFEMYEAIGGKHWRGDDW
jgi:hypothetical protein